MRKASILTAALVTFGVGTFGMARDAHALGPIDLELGAKVGYGSSPSSAYNNPLGFGLGARAGVDFLSIYLGAQFRYYFGTDESAASVTGIESGSVHSHSWVYGIEGGYNITLGPLTIRPQLGLGNTTIATSGQATGVVNVTWKPGSDNNNFYLEPGAVLLVNIGIWYFGADVNLLWVPAVQDSKAALTVDGQVGIKI